MRRFLPLLFPLGVLLIGSWRLSVQSEPPFQPTLAQVEQRRVDYGQRPSGGTGASWKGRHLSGRAWTAE